VVTTPARTLVRLDDRLQVVRTYDAVDGWTLLDAAAHPSGDLTAAYIHVDTTDANPMRIRLVPYRVDGTRVDTNVDPVPPPPGADPGTLAMFSLDRARVVAAGDDVYLAARWAGNAVHVARYAFADGYRPRWSTRVEPEAQVLIVGIIGGGFDNFHQGDSEIFVYLDVDAAGNAYVAVKSTESVLARHDAAFGENLSAGADPGNFDFGAAILTKVDAQGGRAWARLVGAPGR